MSCRHHKKSCDRLEELCLPIYDYVIVGAGTAGAPLAKLLSDDPCVSVKVLEASIDRRADPLVTSSNPFPLQFAPQYHWHTPIDTAPIQPSPFVSPDYLEGFLWGGSSGHNFLLAVRGTPCIYDEWAKIDCRWSYTSMLPAMKYLEKYTPLITGVFNPAERGGSGPLFVTQGGPGVSSLAPYPELIAALASQGAPYSPDYNDPKYGVNVTGEFQNFVRPDDFTRSWAATAFLGPDVVTIQPDGNGTGVGNRQLEVEARAFAVRILFEDEFFCDKKRKHRRKKNELKAIGIEYTKDGQTHRVLARKQVVLSAGAVHSPALLMRSGIGPQDNLCDIGVEPRLINEEVGTGQTHYGPIAFIPTNPNNVFTARMTSFFQENAEPNCRGYQSIIDGTALVGAILFFGFDLIPNRCLKIIATSATDPNGVRVDQNPYEINDDDRANAVSFLKRVARISLAYTGQMPIAPPAALYPITEFGDNGGLASDDSQLFAYALEAGIYTNHISGTARMSECKEDGVVDGELNVHGIENLSVVDTSIMPEIVDGNTALAAFYIGLTKAKMEGACVPF